MSVDRSAVTNLPSHLCTGTHAWYLQGNQVARATSLFEGEMVKRYRVIWGCKANPRWEGNEGAGRGEGFVDSLREGDRILVWARAKVSSIFVLSPPLSCLKKKSLTNPTTTETRMGESRVGYARRCAIHYLNWEKKKKKKKMAKTTN